ncbi:MAG: hypothetical protein QOG43_2266 [Actinomycetota bacterium]|jgi:hypothetical protein|nr:hypothetical protein [Actinomycetota bacterium]
MAASTRAKKSSTTSMPIEGYDQLSIREIVPRLTTLSGPELKAVTAHEKAGKNRVTLLRAVRKVELDREALAPKKGGRSKRLAVVEPENLDADHDLAPIVSVDANNSLDPVPYLEVVEDRHPIDSYGTADDIDAGQSFEMADDFDSDFDADADADSDSDADSESDFESGAHAEPYDNSRSFDLADFDDDFGDEDDVPEVVVAEVVAPPKKAAKAPKAPKASKPIVEKTPPRPRPAVKAATWEEEVRPQLPRRMEAAAVKLEMELEPLAIEHDIDMEPFEHDLRSGGPVGSKAPKQGKTPKAAGGLAAGPLRAIKRFENVALVMAAILAVLLGLAIGTVLARTGSSEARQTPASAVSASAAVHIGS